MLGRRLFGWGVFGEERRGELTAEGVELLAEGVRSTLTYRGYRGPERIASWRKEGLSTAFAVTAGRVVADRRPGRPLLDVPFSHPGVAGMSTGVDDGGKLVIAWDCALLRDDTTGRQELRLRLPDADRDRAVALLRGGGLAPWTADGEGAS